MAAKFLLESGASSYPLALVDIIKNRMNELRCCYITEDKAHLMDEDWDPFFCSSRGIREATTVYYPKNDAYIIYHNTLIATNRRNLWSIAHEIGHIVLGHLKDFDETSHFKSISDDDYRILEKEANFFAAQTLSAPYILDDMGVSSEKDIQRICGISKEASEYRIAQFKNALIFGIYQDEAMVRKSFSAYIEKWNARRIAFEEVII
ncbi:MAG: ImmA/IrrE family metallo-endopeptidase [Clostridia bacterium]|nr:ImmA/IrrE family metallo-endopeptidase [Clostridia bacterium]